MNAQNEGEDGSEKEIENAILQHSPEYKIRFIITWGLHTCEVAGCGTWLICDGGMKPHRIVCAARYSGIRSYTHTNIKTVTGCTKKPAKDQKFCPDHTGQEGPVVLAENLSRNSTCTEKEANCKLSPGQYILCACTVEM